MSNTIINIADPRVICIPIQECGEPLIDLKQQMEINYGPIPEDPATEFDYTKVRESVYKKLCLAQTQLPNGYKFRLYEGLRSHKIQKLLFDNIYKNNQQRYPQLTHDELFYETTKLISPVINLDGTKNIPAHGTGGAVDIEITTKDGALLDMGMAIADWLSVEPTLCQLAHEALSDQQRENRLLLKNVLENVGFINYPNEWWHYSYGDRYWAFTTNAQHAIYGLV